VRRTTRRRLGGVVVGAALLVAFLLPCLCPLPVAFAGSAHSCCPSSETGLRAADPSCCACLEARPSAVAAAERTAAVAAPAAVRAVIAAPPVTLVVSFAPAFGAASPSPPPSILRI
jgi:hypothetical protein